MWGSTYGPEEVLKKDVESLPKGLSYTDDALTHMPAWIAVEILGLFNTIILAVIGMGARQAKKASGESSTFLHESGQ